MSPCSSTERGGGECAKVRDWVTREWSSTAFVKNGKVWFFYTWHEVGNARRKRMQFGFFVLSPAPLPHGLGSTLSPAEVLGDTAALVVQRLTARRGGKAGEVACVFSFACVYFCAKRSKARGEVFPSVLGVTHLFRLQGRGALPRSPGLVYRWQGTTASPSSRLRFSALSLISDRSLHAEWTGCN